MANPTAIDVAAKGLKEGGADGGSFDIFPDRFNIRNVHPALGYLAETRFAEPINWCEALKTEVWLHE